jgi:hypothetical protein
MKAPFWQKGFSEVRILDSPAYAQVQEYIRNNPVKRRLVLTGRVAHFSSSAGWRFGVNTENARVPHFSRPLREVGSDAADSGAELRHAECRRRRIRRPRSRCLPHFAQSSIN